MPSVSASAQPVPPRAVLSGVLCVLTGAALFHFFGNANRGYIDTASLFYWWGFQWANPASETEHGWLVLALSGWLLWRNLRLHPVSSPSRSQNPDTPWPALLALAGGLALHAVGFAAQQARLSIVALLVFAWGVARLVGGRRWGAAALFPLGFLVFAIPVNVLDTLGFWLRLWVLEAAGAIAHLAGIEVLRSGTLLVAPDGRYNYDVAAACSGVRSLTAMAALSLLAGYISFHATWRRVLVLLLCFPLVYFGNVVRIVSIVFAGQLGGQAWGERVHDVMGFGVFAIVLGGVLLAIRALERWWPEAEASGSASETETPGAASPLPALFYTRPLWIGVVVLGLAVAEMSFLHHLATSPARGEVGIALAADGRDPVELPAFVGLEWAGRREAVSSVEREILPPDTGYSRKRYRAIDRSAPEVFFSIVLSGRDRSSIHRPELCLIGQGWTLLDQAEHRFRYPAAVASDRPADFPATVLRVQREVMTPQGKVTRPQLVAYWFVGGDTVVSSHWQRVALDAWNRVRHARADRWAYVLLQTDAADGEAAALARMQAVLDGALPVVQPRIAAR